MRFVVYGAGAIGGSLAAHLVNGGLDVVIVDSLEEHVAAINRSGLRLVGDGININARVRAVTPEQIDFPLDTVLLSVKSHDTASALDVIQPRLSHSGCVVSLQNGLNAYDIAKRLGPGRTIGALVNWAADYMEPGVIQYGGLSNFVLGELDGTISDRVLALAASFRDRFNAEVSPNILGYLWSKQINIALLFTTGITPLTMSDCLDDRQFEPIFAAIAAEGIQLADDYGVALERLDDFVPEAYRAGRIREALTTTAEHYRPMLKQHSGLYRDLAVRMRQSEADGTIGSAIRLGEACGRRMDAHRIVFAKIVEIEHGSRAISTDNLIEVGRGLDGGPI